MRHSIHESGRQPGDPISFSRRTLRIRRSVLKNSLGRIAFGPSASTTPSALLRNGKVTPSSGSGSARTTISTSFSDRRFFSFCLSPINRPYTPRNTSSGSFNFSFSESQRFSFRLDNPGLPHARLAHQNQIVLPALQQDMGDSQHLRPPPDQRRQSSLHRQLRQIPAKPPQGGIFLWFLLLHCLQTFLFLRAIHFKSFDQSHIQERSQLPRTRR